MLHINLLPPERRKLKRTPLYAMVLLVMGLLMVLGAGITTFHFWTELPLLEARVEEERAAAAALEPFARRNEELKRDIDATRSKVVSLRGVLDRKIHWSEVLDVVREAFTNSRVTVKEITLSLGPSPPHPKDVNLPPGRPGTFRVTVTGKLILGLSSKGWEQGMDIPADYAYLEKLKRDLRENPRLRQYFAEVRPRTFEAPPPTTEETEPGLPRQVVVPFVIELLSEKPV